MWDDESLKALRAAVEAHDWPAVAALVQTLLLSVHAGEAKLTERARADILATLRRGRRFAEVLAVADDLALAGLATASTRRQRAQALIEKGDLAGAIESLQLILAAHANDPAEVAEAHGLLGRVHKQRYVSDRSGDALRAAVRSYQAGYTPCPEHRLWHGINLVALAHRAAEDGVVLVPPIDAAAIATHTLHVLACREPNLFAWDYAIGAEACLALGNIEQALTWLQRYVECRNVDAFEVGSTLRQLVEVWQVRDDTAEGVLTQVLRAALLTQEGGGATITAATQKGMREEDTESALERVFSEFGPRPFTMFKRAVARAGGVCRVENTVDEAFGTGFVVRAGDFFPTLGDELLVLTNAHVVGAVSGGALAPEDAQVRFLANGFGPALPVVEAVWMSAPGDLDATFLRVRGLPVDAAPAPLAPPRLPVYSPEAKTRFYAIGYPSGVRAQQLSVSIDDNLQLGWRDTKLHYRTPTEPGSSGSPVFDNEWRLIALHHAGSKVMKRLDGDGTYEANEGIWIHAIAAKTRESGPGFTP